MASYNRRRLLATASSVTIGGVAGCITLGRDRPPADPPTGLTQDAARLLEGEVIYLHGEESNLPTPPETTDTLAEADTVLATATADRTELARALRNGIQVAVAGDSATQAVRNLLDSVRGSYSFGLETVGSRPVSVLVATPIGDCLTTYTFIAEGGWDDPVLDPVGWTRGGIIPDCDTAVPESTADEAFELAGATYTVGRLPAGETYVTSSTGAVRWRDVKPSIRFRTKLFAASNDGYAVEGAARDVELPGNQELDNIFPNTHAKDGVQVANGSDPVGSRFGIEVTPASRRARGALTGCGGFRTEGRLEYEQQTRFEWKRDGYFDVDRRTIGVTGRGEWAFGR